MGLKVPWGRITAGTDALGARLPRIPALAWLLQETRLVDASSVLGTALLCGQPSSSLGRDQTHSRPLLPWGGLIPVWMRWFLRTPLCGELHCPHRAPTPAACGWRTKSQFLPPQGVWSSEPSGASWVGNTAPSQVWRGPGRLGLTPDLGFVSGTPHPSPGADSLSPAPDAKG